MALQLLTTEDHAQPVGDLTRDLVRLRMAPVRDRLVGSAVALYCRWLQDDPDRRPATCRGYRADLAAFADAMDQQGISVLADVDAAAVDLWKHGMAGLEPSTICRKLTAVSGFFDWAVLWDLC